MFDIEEQKYACSLLEEMKMEQSDSEEGESQVRHGPLCFSGLVMTLRAEEPL